ISGTGGLSTMRKSRSWGASLLLIGLVPGTLFATEATRRVWTFDDETIGTIAKGFTNDVGQWSVAESEKGKALAQSAKNANSVFNIALINDASAKELDLSVRMKAVAGDIDQGGGLVWRAKDAKNYYLARYNPL